MTYLMLFILFGAAFLLPAYAVGQQKRESAAEEQRMKQEQQTSADTEQAEKFLNDNERAESWKGTIVLDPGHGGLDNGMVGNTGVSEKQLNLVYAKKLAALLEEEGFRVVLTRTTEDGLYDADTANKKAQDMQRRCAVIEKEQPLLTVSIHQNSYPADPAVRGPQVFYYEHSAEGEALAVCIQKCMNEQLAVKRPRTQKANDSYYILKRSVGVTVLVEVGFLTNPEEERLLQDEVYQEKAVQAICEGILKYINDTNDTGRE